MLAASAGSGWPEHLGVVTAAREHAFARLMLSTDDGPGGSGIHA
jgi:hypothetical protein